MIIVQWEMNPEERDPATTFVHLQVVDDDTCWLLDTIVAS